VTRSGPRSELDGGTSRRISSVVLVVASLGFALAATFHWGRPGRVVLDAIMATVFLFLAVGMWQPRRW
jgi:hypothetical protein